MLLNRQLIRIYYYNAKVGQKEEPERYKHQQPFSPASKPSLLRDAAGTSRLQQLAQLTAL